ncbi:MAG: polysaccharide biosynthesis tyrosine autokinase [Lachnospiraceae bacterium]
MRTAKFGLLKEQGYTMKESLRVLRTNLQFCGDDVKTIVITSAVPNEGKSTVTMQLARSLVELGKGVLVVDTDMRKSVLVGRYKIKDESGGEIFGLSHYLSGQKKLNDVVYATDISKLFMVFAGPAVPNPTEILEKRYFDELLEFGKQNFDYVLVDCAPLGAAIDAAVVAKKCDGAILVVAQGLVGSRMIQGAKKQLESSGIQILGAVLNKVKMKKSTYGKYYGRYYGKYYGKYYGSYYGEYYGDR